MCAGEARRELEAEHLRIHADGQVGTETHLETGVVPSASRDNWYGLSLTQLCLTTALSLTPTSKSSELQGFVVKEKTCTRMAHRIGLHVVWV